ncbi:c-type cytochrome [Persicirhabdus sediminis]|uniref:Cytochrome c n=1 Tax=Persicirhabdus sediminis TaxID=454144 RepID=A0A8J7MGW1_9BACT|nr:cytochrome c [Persicirhabdus sediminis]MBK1792710.1 cytochrome c [Persicirhabdus sediminis]
MKKSLLSIATLTVALFAPAHADEKADLMAAGKAAYGTCQACHGADGKGLKIGDKLMAPPIAGSPFVNGKPDVLALIVLKGVKKEDADYLGIMAPLEAALADDKKLAGVLTYVRNSFGNESAIVTAEEAAKYRAQWAATSSAQSRAKLEELNNAE